MNGVAIGYGDYVSHMPAQNGLVLSAETKQDANGCGYKNAPASTTGIDGDSKLVIPITMGFRFELLLEDTRVYMHPLGVVASVSPLPQTSPPPPSHSPPPSPLLKGFIP